MPANVDAMVRAGVEAFRAGNKTEARALLEKALEADEYNEQAWLWLSAVVETPEEQRTCLENVLVINPKNERARMGLKSLGVDPDALAAPPPAPGQSPFTDNSFMVDNSAPAASPFEADEWDEDAPPTASSSASSASFRPADQHSSSDYDSWIDSMGIGGKKPGAVGGPFESPDLEIEDSGMFGMDEESEPIVPVSPKSSPSQSSSIFDDDDDDLRGSMDDDSELESEDEDFLSSEVMAEFDAALEDETEATLDDLFDDKELADMPDVRTTGEYAMAGNDPDPSVMFAMIPSEIRPASRLPGENESAPRVLLVGVIVLVVLNVAALGFLVTQLG